MSNNNSSDTSASESEGRKHSGKTHRTRLARALAGETGFGYQACLGAVTSAAEVSALPGSLDPATLVAATRIVRPLFEGGGVSTVTPAAPSSALPVGAATSPWTDVESRDVLTGLRRLAAIMAFGSATGDPALVAALVSDCRTERAAAFFEQLESTSLHQAVSSEVGLFGAWAGVLLRNPAGDGDKVVMRLVETVEKELAAPATGSSPSDDVSPSWTLERLAENGSPIPEEVAEIRRAWTLKGLVDNGSMNLDMAADLGWLVQNKVGVLVGGGTGSGKTSLLSALCRSIPRNERVVAVEDVSELLFHPGSNTTVLESRAAGRDTGEPIVRLQDLVSKALDRRPDRVVVGELRGSEAGGFLQGMNTGMGGGLATMHANSPDGIRHRLGTLVSWGGEVAPGDIEGLIGGALGVIVMVRRYEDGIRRVQGIQELTSHQNDAGALSTVPLWTWEHTRTLPDGRFDGEYVKHNDFSAEFLDTWGLEHADRFTVADVNRVSMLG